MACFMIKLKNEKSVTSSNSKTIEGTFVPNGDFYTGAGGYIFDKNGNVEAFSNFSEYGTYTISGSTIKIVFAEEIEPQNFTREKSQIHIK